MHVPESKNGSTPRKRGVVFKLGQGVRGVLPKMSSRPTPSTNSSSLTREAFGSRPTSLGGSSLTPSGEISHHGSSLSSPVSESASLARLSECERENTLTIHFVTYGTKEQAEQTARSILWDLKVKGHNVIHAIHDQEAVPVPEKKP